MKEIDKNQNILGILKCRLVQRVNLDSKGFSKGFFTGKIQTKRFSKGFFTGEIQTKRFSKDSRRVEDPVQTPPLPPLWVFMTPSLTWNLKYFCLFDIIM